MQKVWRMAVGGVLAMVIGGATVAGFGAGAGSAGGADLSAFNTKFREVILRMDNDASMALWAEDGVSLMPDAEPLVGKTAIAGFLNRVMKDLVGYHVMKEEIDWRDMRVSGDWASEWGIVHQEVIPPGDKPAIEVYGRIILVLHKDAGEWKIQQEAWQSGPKQ